MDRSVILFHYSALLTKTNESIKFDYILCLFSTDRVMEFDHQDDGV